MVLWLPGLSKSRGVAAALTGNFAWWVWQEHGVAALTDINHSTCGEEFNSPHWDLQALEDPSQGTSSYWGFDKARVIITPVLQELQPGALAAENNPPPVQLKLCSSRPRRAHKRLLSTQPLCDHCGWYWLLEVNNIYCLF